MRVRILGNSASGKSTLARKIGDYYNIETINLDKYAFIPNSDFIKRDKGDMVSDLSQILVNTTNYVMDGNYISTTDSLMLFPTHIIYIDLPTEQNLYNLNCRYEQYKGTSRPDVPGCIESEPEHEMIDWINTYEERRGRMESYISSLCISHPEAMFLRLEDMGEVIALCNNPGLLEGEQYDRITKDD